MGRKPKDEKIDNNQPKIQEEPKKIQPKVQEEVQKVKAINKTKYILNTFFYTCSNCEFGDIQKGFKYCPICGKEINEFES